METSRFTEPRREASMEIRKGRLWKSGAVQFSLALMLLAAPLVAQDEAEVAAKKQALEWLALVDHGEYEKSWEEAATIFREALTSEQWVDTLKQGWESLGSVEKREMESNQFHSEGGGGVVGPVVILQFRTRFAGGAFTETVSVVQEGEEWRVAGYFIRP
jgi:hypothetical protein